MVHSTNAQAQNISLAGGMPVTEIRHAPVIDHAEASPRVPQAVPTSALLDTHGIDETGCPFQDCANQLRGKAKDVYKVCFFLYSMNHIQQSFCK